MHFSSFTWCVLVLMLPAKCMNTGDSCFIDDQAGTCVRISECTSLVDEIKRAGRPITMHMRQKLFERSCGFERNEPVICCTSSGLSRYSIMPDTVDNNTPTENFDDSTSATMSLDPESRVGNGVPDIQKHPNLHLLPTQTCGINDDSGGFRILQGNRTGLFEMPWMVLLAYDSPRGRRHGCSGTLINERYVLTAAHCISYLKNLKFVGVVLGEWDTTKDPDCERIEGEEELFCALPAKNVTVESMVAHKGYSPQTLLDDIALLRLSEPVDFDSGSGRTKPICLPVTSKLQNEDLVGKEAVVAGWGVTEDGMQSEVLLSVELPILGNKECQNAYKGSPRIYDRQICAGGIVDRDTCAGDSGGPLMYYGNVGSKYTRFVQRGLLSYGTKQCGIGLPGVYTRISHYMDWILDNMYE